MRIRNLFNRTIEDILKVSLSNICIVISGIFVGFLIPKILGVTEYGYYKTFTLYSTYVGIFSFGISEGIYLKYSGIKYEEMNYDRIRFFSRVFILLELICALAVAFFAIFFLKKEYKYILLAISLYLFELNITTYFQYIAQMTMNFSYYSMRNIVKSVLTVMSVGIVTALYYYNNKQVLSYKIYLLFVLIISTILLCLYLWKYRDVVVGKIHSKDNYFSELNGIMRVGVPFLISSMCSTLILSIDRQFVSIYFDTRTYGIYAFAYNMLGLVTVCTSAISTVIYPKLKQTTEAKVKDIHPLLISYVSSFVSVALCSYFPLCFFVRWFLPQYVNSLVIFRIVFPGLIFSSTISVVMQNYYKLFDKTLLFFLINLVILGLSALANIIAIKYYGTSESVSIASIFVLVAYYIGAEYYFIKKYNIHWIKNFIYSLISATGFYAITGIKNEFISFGIYIVFAVTLIVLFFPNMVKKIRIQIDR